MYLNLLANSMDSSKDKDVHPSFVDLIKQMNSLDAKVFDKLAGNLGYQKVINPTISVKGEGKFFADAAPEWFIGWTISGYDFFDVSSSLVRLSKFGLVELMYDRTAGTAGYQNLQAHQFLISILHKHQASNPNLTLEVGATKSVLYVNEYGKQFKKACK